MQCHCNAFFQVRDFFKFDQWDFSTEFLYIESLQLISKRIFIKNVKMIYSKSLIHTVNISDFLNFFLQICERFNCNNDIVSTETGLREETDDIEEHDNVWMFELHLNIMLITVKPTSLT